MKYLITEELLLAYIKSFLPYQKVKSLAEVSEHDVKIFTKELHRQIKRDGIEAVKRQIRNMAVYYKMELKNL